MKFTKMQGLGNDYLYHFGELADPAGLSRKLSDRHFGIGSDGLILILPSETADFKMRIFNADGSEAKMCGNGIRCVGKYVYEKGYTKKRELSIETLSGIKSLFLQLQGEKVQQVSVNMGQYVAEPPVVLETTYGKVKVTPVSVGNPHAVIFADRADSLLLQTVGKELEHHPYFKNGVNVEFVQITSRTTFRMRVWERGSGITMACGTGACASAAAAIQAGFCDVESDIVAHLDGGILKIAVSDNHAVQMTGPAEFICECEVEQ